MNAIERRILNWLADQVLPVGPWVKEKAKDFTPPSQSQCRAPTAKPSVVNRWCRLHESENLFVVDSSFMPMGLGLNPAVTVVANALHVGTHIAELCDKAELREINLN